MRIEDLTPDLALQLEAAWLAAMPARADHQRSLDYLAWLLAESDSSWYQIEGRRAWLYVTNIVRGLSADLHALNLDGWAAVDPPKVRDELKAIMDEFDLHRLTAVIPAPVGKLHKALKMLGFTKEGQVRGAMIFNGRPTDAVVYGLLRREVEPAQEGQAAPTKRRRRRRRRKGAQWEPKTQPERQSEPEPSLSDSKPSTLPTNSGSSTPLTLPSLLA